MKNKKGSIEVMIIVLMLLIAILIILLIFHVIGNNLCSDACLGALEFDTKEAGSIYDFLNGDYKLTCVCYYSDRIETKVVKEKI